MLRGQGSLQSLFGRSFRKNGVKNQAGPTDGADKETISPSGESGVTEAVTERDVKDDDALPPVFPASAPAQPSPGCVLCPLCSRELKNDNAVVNSHIDTCLLKGRQKKARQQTTLLQFAARTPQPSVTAGPSAAALNEATGCRQESAASGSGVLAGSSTHAAAAIDVMACMVAPPLSTRQAHRASSLAPAQPRPNPTYPLQPSKQPHSGQVKQERQQERDPPGNLTAATLSIAHCLVVGRQYQNGGTICPAGQRVGVQWEEGNPRDPHALLVSHAASGTALGHLPFTVARHLAPLVRWQGVVVEGVVLEDVADRAPLPVQLQISLLGPPASPQGKSWQKLLAVVQQAQHAASEHAGRQLGTGERLRANFSAVVETVAQHDAHLLDEAEQAFIRTYQDLPPPCQCLLLRLFQRRGPWFRTGTLSYAEVPEMHAALHRLCDEGLANMEHAAGHAVIASAPAAVEAAAAAVETGAAAGSGEAEAASSECSWSSDSAGKPSSEAVDQDAETSTACQSAAEPAAALPSSVSTGATGCLQLPQHPFAASERQQDSASWQELADLITVPEISAVLASSLGLGGGAVGGSRATSRAAGVGNRGQLLEALGMLAATHEAGVRRALLQATGEVVRLARGCREAINRICRLFFLNEGHTLSQFLAVDLGGVRYPQYRVHRSRSAFANRSALLEYEQAVRHAETLTEALEAGDVGAAELVLQHAWAAIDAGTHKQLGATGAEVPPFLKRFHAGWVYCMMATVGVSLLERQRNYQQAIHRLQQLLGGQCTPSRRGEWWLRLSVDTEHLGRAAEALEVAEAALADEWLSHGDRLALQRRVLRLGKPPRRWKKPVWADAASREPPERRIEGRPLSSNVGMKSRFYGLDGEQCSVEELALQYYASEEGGGWSGVHSEGGIWAMLFGLLLWEVLFAPVPDVLRTPFQTAPLDLDTDAFFGARQDAIEEVLTRIRAGEAPTMLQCTWQTQYGVLCRGVSWERYTLEELQVVARCIGGQGLAAVCRLLAEDHAGWSGGVPDLLLWHTGRCVAMLSEVKGPRDRLSDQQRAWMNALASSGLACEVLKVVEPGAGFKRQRAGP